MKRIVEDEEGEHEVEVEVGVRIRPRRRRRRQRERRSPLGDEAEQQAVYEEHDGHRDVELELRADHLSDHRDEERGAREEQLLLAYVADVCRVVCVMRRVVVRRVDGDVVAHRHEARHVGVVVIGCVRIGVRRVRHGSAGLD
eukprot:4349588-Prymnesium_polylepis.3